MTASWISSHIFVRDQEGYKCGFCIIISPIMISCMFFVSQWPDIQQIHKYTKFHGAVDQETEVMTKNKNCHHKNSQNFGVYLWMDAYINSGMFIQVQCVIVCLSLRVAVTSCLAGCLGLDYIMSWLFPINNSL